MFNKLRAKSVVKRLTRFFDDLFTLGITPFLTGKTELGITIYFHDGAESEWKIFTERYHIDIGSKDKKTGVQYGKYYYAIETKIYDIDVQLYSPAFPIPNFNPAEIDKKNAEEYRERRVQEAEYTIASLLYQAYKNGDVRPDLQTIQKAEDKIGKRWQYALNILEGK